MMQVKLLATVAALLITQSAMAVTTPDPFPCPTVRALQDVGISTTRWNALGGPEKAWSGIEPSNKFYTPVSWTLIITIDGLKDKHKNEILARMNTAISSLILEGGPYPINDSDFPKDSYYCKYFSTDGSSDWAFTITPAVNFDRPLQFAKLHK